MLNQLQVMWTKVMPQTSQNHIYMHRASCGSIWARPTRLVAYGKSNRSVFLPKELPLSGLEENPFLSPHTILYSLYSHAICEGNIRINDNLVNYPFNPTPPTHTYTQAHIYKCMHTCAHTNTAVWESKLQSWSQAHQTWAELLAHWIHCRTYSH